MNSRYIRLRIISSNLSNDVDELLNIRERNFKMSDFVEEFKRITNNLNEAQADLEYELSQWLLEDIDESK